jgi:hypothetical protein
MGLGLGLRWGMGMFDMDWMIFLLFSLWMGGCSIHRVEGAVRRVHGDGGGGEEDED